jgi:hypothetical protein
MRLTSSWSDARSVGPFAVDMGDAPFEATALRTNLDFFRPSITDASPLFPA